MADEIQSGSVKKMGLIKKLIIYGITLATGIAAGVAHGKYSSEIKNIAIRNVAGDYKDDVVVTYRNGTKNAFIQQPDGSYVIWDKNEERKNLSKSIEDALKNIENEISRDPVKKIESEINK